MAVPEYRVTHHRPDDSDLDRRIEGLAGPSGANGNFWYEDIDTLIQGIENSIYRLWTVDTAGNSVWIVVDENRNRKFLRTQSDGVIPNNLLALPHY